MKAKSRMSRISNLLIALGVCVLIFYSYSYGKAVAKFRIEREFGIARLIDDGIRLKNPDSPIELTESRFREFYAENEELILYEFADPSGLATFTIQASCVLDGADCHEIMILWKLDGKDEGYSIVQFDGNGLPAYRMFRVDDNLTGDQTIYAASKSVFLFDGVVLKRDGRLWIHEVLYEDDDELVGNPHVNP